MSIVPQHNSPSTPCTFSLFYPRYRLNLLGLFVIQLGQVSISKPADQKCTNPSVEILKSEWKIYMNLPQINVYSCKVTKNPGNCGNPNVKTETIVYYDVTRSCLDMARSGNIEPTSIITKSVCNANYTSEVMEEKNFTSKKARVNFKTDQVFLPSNTKCRYSSGFCYDSTEGYVWDTELQDGLSCSDLVLLQMPGSLSGILEFTLRKKYLVFEGKLHSFAVELVREVNLCGGRAWTDDAGVVVTNDTFEERATYVQRHASDYISLSKKHDLYQSLVLECQSGAGEVHDFSFYAIAFLLVYMSLHFACSLYNRATDYRTMRKLKGEPYKFLFQSWVNRFMANTNMVVETKLRSDIEMDKLERKEIPSYCEFKGR